jgi:CheY-like chemotaxis protein
MWVFARETQNALPNSSKVEPMFEIELNRRNEEAADRMITTMEGLSREKSGCLSPELHWLADKIRNRFPFFDDGEIPSLRRESPSIIYVFSSERDDPISNTVEGMRHRFPNAAIRVILGEWWTGHRRTQTLPVGIAVAYWYQAYDLILPELDNILESLASSIGEHRTRTSSNSTPATDESKGLVVESQEVTRSTLIVSDHADNRRLWADVGSNLGLTTVGIRGLEALPEGNFSLVILDNRLDPTSEQVEKMRRAYPTARLLIGLNFPCWRTVDACLHAGADWFVGKPFQLAGLGRTFSSAALDRR